MRIQRVRPTVQNTTRYSELDGYCDSLDRNGDVQIVLKASREKGYALWIESDGDIRKVVNDNGKQVWFRTVDQALDELINVPYLSEIFIIERSNW